MNNSWFVFKGVSGKKKHGEWCGPARIQVLPINLTPDAPTPPAGSPGRDVTVSVEYQGVREEFMAHKAVLSATSKFFKEVFLNEKTVDGARTNVYLDEVQVADFASFLEFVYAAKVQVEEDRVQRMLKWRKS